MERHKKIFDDGRKGVQSKRYTHHLPRYKMQIVNPARGEEDVEIRSADVVLNSGSYLPISLSKTPARSASHVGIDQLLPLC